MVMTGKHLRNALLLLVLATLAGCQSTGLKDGDDATGNLGAVHGRGPSDVYVDLAIGYLQQQNYTAAKADFEPDLVDLRSKKTAKVAGCRFRQIQFQQRQQLVADGALQRPQCLAIASAEKRFR